VDHEDDARASFEGRGVHLEELSALFQLRLFQLVRFHGLAREVDEARVRAGLLERPADRRSPA
jgi:hypothetical protein